MKKIIIPVIFSGLLLTSCASREKIAYYQNIDQTEIVNKKFETKIKNDDLLMIIVSAQDPVAVQPFNLNSTSSHVQEKFYLVDQQGYIDFPTLGKIEVANKTKNEIIENLQQKISRYVNNPIINLRIMNFKVTVQGEVKMPGTHTINSERITLMEAVTLSGDLTNYGKRDNILVLREENGEIKSHRVDLTKADFINSDFYYLKQNDVVYVEPNKVAVNSSAVGANVSIYMAAISLLITTTTLILSNTKK